MSLKIHEGFYDCFIDEQSEFEISVPMTVYKNSNSIKVCWAGTSDVLFFFSHSKNCLLGTTKDGELKAVVLTALNEEIVSCILAG